MADVINAVCGMHLDDQQTAITSQYMNGTYFFCSLGCKQQFDNDPQRHAMPPSQGARSDDQALAGHGPMACARWIVALLASPTLERSVWPVEHRAENLWRMRERRGDDRLWIPV
jgi:YHS domain-containing protein